MRGDYTRFSFKPGNDYAGVRMQQGRVQLDADFNEQAELLDRRLRVGTMDALGRGVVPRETPDGFRVELDGNTVAIGRGRAYVDGLLAENHGADPAEYDASLGEQRGSAPLTYEKQPYRPVDPEKQPLEGTHIAYLDVWERELTYIGNPDLIERAVGFDTSTRQQTVWQVGLVEAPAGTLCGDEVPKWKERTAPSAGRLTTRSVGVPVPEEPCTVPLAGGYRGTENRLYRVEIHDPGPLGKATFKWSRDNGSVASPVTEIDAAGKVMKLVSIGRDGAQRLRPGDWVEVSDDCRELAGRPGEMRKIEDVEEETQTIKLATALPAGEFKAGDPCRHTRVTRWDGYGAEVDAGNGVLKVPEDGKDAPVRLGEEGVEIAFDVAVEKGQFRSGDWWAFAARTADATVEKLSDEPPRGVHHHYTRLAVVDFDKGTVTDCRTLWPPEGGGEGCECTVCVSPEEHAKGTMTIQMAVDLLKRRGGGKVCLEVGMYPLEKPIRMQNTTSICIEGKGEATVLVPTRGLPAMYLLGANGATIENLAIRAGSEIQDPVESAVVVGGLGGVAIALHHVVDVTVRGCLLTQVKGGRSDGPLISLLGGATRVRIRDNNFSGGIGIAGRGGVRFLTKEAGGELEEAAVSGYTMFLFGLWIEDNTFDCTQAGIAFQPFTLIQSHVRIVGNRIRGCEAAAVGVAGMLTSGTASVDVIGNSIVPTGDGIVAGIDDVRIADNDIAAPPETGHEWGRNGIVLGVGPGHREMHRCSVRGNRVVGLTGEGILVRVPIASAQIEANVIEFMGGAGISMERGASASTLKVERNQLVDVAPKVDEHGNAAGIRIAAAKRVSVVGNTVFVVGREAKLGKDRHGIRLVGCGVTRIAGNEVADIGPVKGFAEGTGFGIGVYEPLSSVDVVDNQACRNRVPQSGTINDLWNTLAILSHHPGVHIERADDRIRPPELPPPSPDVLRVDDRALVLRARGVVESEGFPSHYNVTGNVFESYGQAPCAVLWGCNSSVFAHNRCILFGNASQPVAWIMAPPPPPGLLIFTPPPPVTIVDGNHVGGPSDSIGIYLELPPSRAYTVLGNVVSGSMPIRVNNTVLGLPWAALNVTA